MAKTTEDDESDRKKKPVPAEGNRRVQFSVYMDAEVKDKLESLAAIRRVSLSQLLEQLGRYEIRSIDQATWDMIKSLRKKVG